mgnify:FL=1
MPVICANADRAQSWQMQGGFVELCQQAAKSVVSQLE